MNEFHFRQIEISAEWLCRLTDFSCGVEAMDNMLHSQCLFAELNIEDPIAYCVHNEEETLVGFCIIGKTVYPLKHKEQNVYVPTIDVTCLAVHKGYQHQGIGTAILNALCEKVDTYMPEALYLHVDALDLEDRTYSAVGFYEQYGFAYLCRSGADTASMFYRLSKRE